MKDSPLENWDAGMKRPYAKYMLWTALLAFGGVAIALGLQFWSGMEPCAWCTFQRLVYLVLGAVALLAWLLASTPGLARTLSGLAGLLAGGGVVAALYQHFVAAKTASCALTFADKVITGLKLNEFMPWMFEATAMCDEANIPWLGVPFALWSAALFSALLVLTAITTFSRGQLR